MPFLHHMGLIPRYWRGEVSLPVSFWVLNSTATIAVGIVVALLNYSASLWDAYSPASLFFIVFNGWLVVIPVDVWKSVGLFRSAGAFITQNRAGWRLLAYAAKIWAIFSLAWTLNIFATSGFSQLVEVSKMLFANDSDVTDYEVFLSEDSREVHVRGGFKYGLAADLRLLLERTPAVEVVVFESNGGRVVEGRKVYDLIKEKQLSTAVNTYCRSACALAFMAGRNRWLGAGGQIGFHAPSGVGLDQARVIASVEKFEQQISTDTGTPMTFFERAHGVDSDDIWHPTRKELLNYKIITEAFSFAPSSIRKFKNFVREN